MSEQDIKIRLENQGNILNERGLKQPIPKNMLLEVSNICNHMCAFCANSKSNRKRGIIDKQFAMRILTDAYMLGVREVGFYACGEPLIDKNLETYIAYAKEIGFEYVYITTNGGLFDLARMHGIIDAGIDSIKFSINGASKEDYLLIHGKDDFDKVIENLKLLSELRKIRKFKLYISFIMTKQTMGTKEKFVREYGKYVDDIVFLKCENQTGYMHELNELLAINGDAKGFGMINKNGICSLVFNKLHITYEGYLTMCCADFQNYLVIADLNKENLAEAWNNQYAQDLRKCHIEHNLEGTLCYNCIHNCVSDIQPLRKEYAVPFDMHTWDKSKEIEERIRMWESEKYKP